MIRQSQLSSELKCEGALGVQQNGFQVSSKIALKVQLKSTSA